jgi:hypothetical protein
MFKAVRRAAVLALFCGGTAAASSLVYDGFNYLPGALSGNNGGVGFAAPWLADPGVTVQPPGLSHPLALPSTGLEVGGAFNSARPLSSALGLPEYWVSFQINSNPGNDQVWLGLDTAASSTPLVWFGRRLNTYFIQQGTTAAITGGVASPVGVTDLLVARFQQSGALTNVDLWVNTNNFALPPLISTVVPTVPYTWANMQVQSGLFADEIRIGTTPLDVATPEPASLALLAMAGLGLPRRRVPAPQQI